MLGVLAFVGMADANLLQVGWGFPAGVRASVRSPGPFASLGGGMFAGGRHGFIYQTVQDRTGRRRISIEAQRRGSAAANAGSRCMRSTTARLKSLVSGRYRLGLLELPAQHKINERMSLGGHMTTETLNRLRTQISALSTSERAALAHEIIAGLDGVHDEAAEQAWDDEILRRLAQVEAGQVELLTRDEFRRKMRGRLGN